MSERYDHGLTRMTTIGALVVTFALTAAAGSYAQTPRGDGGAAKEGSQPSAADAQADTPREPTGAVRLTWTNDRPSLRFWGDAVHIDLRVRLQGDVLNAGAEPTSPDALELRRRRVGVSGSIGRFVEFQVERELWSDKRWRDVFVDVKLASAAQVKVGQFKLPFSLDELTSSTTLDFVSRSLAAGALAPARDIGVMLHGRSALPGGGPRIQYELGMFRHDGDNAGLGPLTLLSPDGGASVSRRTVAARLQVSPFDRSTRDAAGKAAKKGAPKKPRSALQSLRFGVAMTTNEMPEGDNGLRGQDVLSKPFFPRLDVKGRRLRVGTEASWHGGPAAVRAEFIQVRDQRLGQGLDNGDLPPLVSTGWYVQGTWSLVKGGKKATPAGRWIGRGGVGDIELAARAERLSFGSDGTGGEPQSGSPRAANLAPVSDTVHTFGVNWRPIPLTRIQVNAARDRVEGFPWTKRDGQDVVWSIVARFQFAF